MKHSLLIATVLILVGFLAGNASAAEKSHFPKEDYIKMEDTYKMFVDKQAFFLDSRSEFAFLKGRVPGSMQIQAGKTEGKIEQLKKIKKPMFIAYCYGPGCPLAEYLAIDLKKKGISNVKVFIEGWAGWSHAGYPVESGFN